jgi:hypothetical protein
MSYEPSCVPMKGSRSFPSSWNLGSLAQTFWANSYCRIKLAQPTKAAMPRSTPSSGAPSGSGGPYVPPRRMMRRRFHVHGGVARVHAPDERIFRRVREERLNEHLVHVLPRCIPGERPQLIPERTHGPGSRLLQYHDGRSGAPFLGAERRFGGGRKAHHRTRAAREATAGIGEKKNEVRMSLTPDAAVPPTTRAAATRTARSRARSDSTWGSARTASPVARSERSAFACRARRSVPN